MSYLIILNKADFYVVFLVCKSVKAIIKPRSLIRRWKIAKCQVRKGKKLRRLNGATVEFIESDIYVLKGVRGVNRDVEKRDTKRGKRMVLLLQT